MYTDIIIFGSLQWVSC